LRSPVNSTLQRALRSTLRLKPACNFGAVREAAQVARDWLATQGVLDSELASWELVLVEAGNNAVEHAPKETQVLPIEFEISCGEADVEARVTDHTIGFDLPKEVELPDSENEGSRGLFLIKSLTDHAEYWRGLGANRLILRKCRSAVAGAELPNDLELQRRLLESETALGEMAEELSSSYESLVAVFRYSAELGASTELSDFAKRLIHDLAQLTAADAVVLRLFARERLELFLALPEPLRDCLPVLDPAHPVVSVELEASRTREDVWFGGERTVDINDPLRAIPGLCLGVVHAFGLNDQLLGTVTLARCGDETPFRSAEINLLHTFVDFFAIQTVNRRLLDERAQARVTQRELEIAASIQRSLLPVILPACHPFELAASCLSARQVGGDYYDAIQVNDHAVLLIIADVMGKGVPAALFAAVLRSAVRSMPGFFTRPAALLSAVNRTLYEDLARVDMFVTAKFAFLDTRHAQITSASAGHCPLLIWQPGTVSARPVDDSGLPLGLDPNSSYTETGSTLPPGAIGLLYTDGLTESRDPSGEMLGDKRLAAMLPALSSKSLSSENIGNSLLAQLESFRSGALLNDDQTFILLRNPL
jgi:serine phosphatase RsbU (regulator of sigma subunit)/anti-sigma regulatory factor (Ser/Thr protein kinase)